MHYPLKNQFITTNPKSQHLDIPDFIIGWQNYYFFTYGETASSKKKIAQNPVHLQDRFI